MRFINFTVCLVLLCLAVAANAGNIYWNGASKFVRIIGHSLHPQNQQLNHNNAAETKCFAPQAIYRHHVKRHALDPYARMN